MAGPSFSNADLDRALSADEFYCVYQPRVELLSGTMRGAESLVRWAHPEYGDLLPQLFLPYVERQGRMHEITARVIDCALATAAELDHRGLNVRMHINMSAQDFAFPGASAAFAIRTRRHGLKSSAVRLELSESDFGKLSHAGKDRLMRLVGQGFSLAMQGLADKPVREDDDLPLAEIQIIGHDLFALAEALNTTGSGRLNGMIRAAKKQGRRVTAIGLSSMHDIELAKALGFETATGRAIAAPMARADFMEWAQDRAKTKATQETSADKASA